MEMTNSFNSVSGGSAIELYLLVHQRGRRIFARYGFDTFHATPSATLTTTMRSGPIEGRKGVGGPRVLVFHKIDHVK